MQFGRAPFTTARGSSHGIFCGQSSEPSFSTIAMQGVFTDASALHIWNAQCISLHPELPKLVVVLNTILSFPGVCEHSVSPHGRRA